MVEHGIIYTQAAQKFNKLLVKGCCLNGVDVDVLCLVKEPKFLFPKKYIETYNGHKITYSFCILQGNRRDRLKKRKHFVRKSVNDYIKKNCGEGGLILDSLSPIALEAAKYARHKGVKVVTHITDFRDLLYGRASSLKQRVQQFILNKRFYRQFKYTSVFILLTEEMKDRIKIKNRPCLIMDGVCDYELKDSYIADYAKEKKIFLYTGSLNVKYGIKNLVEGFIKADIPTAELHLYGWGDYVEELKEITKKHSNILYFETIPNSEIVKKQAQATFCVNPRPVKDLYTKYSFPSKTIEYLVSGTPVITTMLPCITQEYNPYVFWFDDDTVEGIATTLKRCAEMDGSELKEKGLKARHYIIEEKNNQKQIRKLIDIISKLE